MEIPEISGRELIETGLIQLTSFGVDVAVARVAGVTKEENFKVLTEYMPAMG